MALRTAIRNGSWGDPVPATNPWGAAPPAGADTFATSTFIVTVDDLYGACGCAGGTITLGGTLINASTAGGGNFTLTGAVTHNGTFTMLGNGSNIAPRIMTLNGCVWTCGVAAIWNMVGTLAYTGPDVKIVGNATSYFDFALRPGIIGTITKCEFNTFGGGSVCPLYRPFSFPGSGLTISDLYFNGVVGATAGWRGASGVSPASICLTGNILFNNVSAIYAFNNSNVTGSATITIQNSTGVSLCAINAGVIKGTTQIVYNEVSSTNKILSSIFGEQATLTILDVAATNTINSSTWMGAASLTLASSTNGRTFFQGTTIGSCSNTGAISINGKNGLTLFTSIPDFVMHDLRITVTTGTVVLQTISEKQSYWQSSRSVSLGIFNATGIDLHGTGSVTQYEPVLYKYNIVTYLFGIQYDLHPQCPNYTDLYGASTGWTPATKTLAAGGVLRIYTTGHTATGMDMAISSFAGFSLTTTGTAVVTAQYYISFDGGVLWSAALTLAQLQANTYIINGNNYNTDPRYNIQLRIALTSAGGGTVTQVSVTGITYNPAVTGAWDVRTTLNDIEGPSFTAGTDDLRSIRVLITALGTVVGAITTVLTGITSLANWLKGLFRKDAMNVVAKAEVNAGGGTYDEATDSQEGMSDKIGVPVALDGGAATIASNLTKMADDAGGVVYDATTDSLHAIGAVISGGLNVNVVQISGSGPAADNAKYVLLGTGALNDVDLSARSLVINNDTGDAVVFESTGGNGRGLYLLGDGAGQGLSIASTHALALYINSANFTAARITGGSGSGLQIQGNGGYGVQITSASSNGLNVSSGGNSHGTLSTGSGTGHGFSMVRGGGAGSKDIDANEIDLILTEIGTPVALSGGTADLSNNLTKIADNAGGAAFNSGTDSLHELHLQIAAIGPILAGAVAQILKGVNWLVMKWKKKFGGND